MSIPTPDELRRARGARAHAIAGAGGLETALTCGALPSTVDITLSEAIVLGLLRQGVRTFLAVFGHGSTEVAEVLRIYESAGLLRTVNVRHEGEASHAAMALRWVTGERAAVVTSIGPGALHALAASLAPASDGIGVWYLFGDETTEDEGYNMQQIPRHEQGLFLRACSAMGNAYSLHTPLALPSALRMGLNTVEHPYRPGPFYLLMPMNTQAAYLPGFNLHELPCGPVPRIGPAPAELCEEAVRLILGAERPLVKLGGGAAGASAELVGFLELSGAVAVHTPIATGIVPYTNPRNMTIGGSKGSLCGNYAMENADLLIAVGTRSVCQSDSSRTGYPNVRQVVNINGDVDAALHYNRTVGLIGDVAATLRCLNAILRVAAVPERGPESAWLRACLEQRRAWEAFKAERYACPTLYDESRGETLLTQPAVVHHAAAWARSHDVPVFFDAGDVQANGFQIVEDDRPGRTFTETGASYMGFAVSSLLATGLATPPFYGLAISGDGSFTMSPQVLIDGAEHGARGCILLLDNRAMSAISGLQVDQYGHEHKTHDGVAVDYVKWAEAVPGVLAIGPVHTLDELSASLARSRAHPGLSLIHVPTYYGPDPLGGMGVFGRWNVGNWCETTQALRHRIGL